MTITITKFNKAISSAVKKMHEYSKGANRRTIEIEFPLDRIILCYENDDMVMKMCLEITEDEIIELYFDVEEEE